MGFTIGGVLAVNIFVDRMLVYSAEWTGYVTQDALFGGMVPYGPGLHLSHWWEVRNAVGNYSLKVVPGSFTANISVVDSKVAVRGKYEFVINLPFIASAIGVGGEAIETAITAFVNSFLTSECAGKKMDDVRTMIDDLNSKLNGLFSSQGGVVGALVSFFSKYGLIMVSIVIDKIDLPDDVQRTMDGIAEARLLHKVAEELAGMPPGELTRRLMANEMTPEQHTVLRRDAMAVSKNAEMKIQVLDVPALLADAAKKFVKGARP